MSPSIKLFFIALILFSGSRYASAQNNYLDYHKQIIKAEELFIKNDIESSLTLYKEIFGRYKPFARDCFIAVQLAALQNDTTNAIYFFQKCFESGISWPCMEFSVGLTRWLEKMPVYKERLVKIEKICRTKYVKSIDFNIRSEVTSLMKKDDLFKLIPNEFGTLNYRDSLFAGVIENNMKRVVEITNLIGFPGERLIGIQNPQMDQYDFQNKDREYYARFEPITTILFYHYSCGYFLLKKQLMESVIKGELHPRNYALIYEWAYEGIKNNGTNISRFYRNNCVQEKRTKYYNLYINHLLDNPDTALVNRCRAELGISSIAHDKRKEDFAKKNKIILFFGFGVWPEQYKGYL